MEDHDLHFCTLAPPDSGLLALGVLSLLAPRTHVAWRLAGGGLTAAGFYGLLATAFASPTLFAHFVAAVAATVVTVAAVRGATATSLPRRLATPLGYGSVLAAVGLAGLVALFLYHAEKVDRSGVDTEDVLALMSCTPDRVPVEGVHAVTDRGYAVPICRARDPRADNPDGREAEALAMRPWGDATIRRQASDDDSNCHGWVFAGGRYIVPGSAVEQILHDNGYAAVPTPAPGDLTVYRGPAGNVLHTAVVRYAAPGRPPMVEGKWGRMGVYLHAADESGYGKGYAFYRSPRDGDVLKGIDGSTGARLAGAE